MKRDHSIYLSDISENIDKAEQFIGDMSLDEFKEDEKTFYAVTRCLETIRAVLLPCASGH